MAPRFIPPSNDDAADNAIQIAENGITVAGGGSLIRGIDKLIEANTKIKTRVADEPETCGAYGAGKALDWINDMQEGTINIARRRQMM